MNALANCPKCGSPCDGIRHGADPRFPGEKARTLMWTARCSDAMCNHAFTRFTREDAEQSWNRAAAPEVPSVPDEVAAAARHFKFEGGHIGGLGVSRAANILFDYINGVLAASPEVKP